ncbi:glycosyltransferase family 1 protein [bacterium]|nr:glycosyltransferase family 1 protein [bacterium]
MGGYNVLIPDVCRNLLPQTTLPLMDALKETANTPVVMEMHSITAMYRQFRYESHGSYEIFKFYFKDLMKQYNVDFGLSVGLGCIMEDEQKGESHHIIDEAGIPNLIYLHCRDRRIAEKLKEMGAEAWEHSFIATSSRALADLLLDQGLSGTVHCPLGTSFRLFYPATSPPENAAYPLLNDDPRLTADFDVSFVGGYCPGRERYLQALSEAGVALAVFGDGRWKDSKLLRGHWRNEVRYLTELNTVYNASKINLDLPHDECLFPDYVSSRVYDCLASGSFLLTHRRDELEETVEVDKEVAAFEGEEELLRSVHYYLGNEAARLKVAARGHRRIAAGAGWVKRLALLMPRLEMQLLGSPGVPARDSALAADNVAVL